MEHEEGRDEGDELEYRQPQTIDPSELREGLQSLALFGSDPNMRQQAFNLGLIDGFAMQLETQLLKKQLHEEPFLPESAFLNAISQMWIFAAYELMRTWRQRASDMTKWAENGGLQTKLDQLRKETGFTHFGREMRARQIEQVISDPALVGQIRSDLRKTHIPFARMEAIRVSIAKHEVRGRPKSVALMPTHGRINMWCGSLDYELSLDSVSMGTISRRNIADDIRAIPQIAEPTDEDIKSFEQYMRGPSAEDLASIFAAAPPQEI
jgi:hypothetical protein